MEENVPDWAIRHDYFHHSNYRLKSKAEIFFDKCFVRPTVKLAWEAQQRKDLSQDQKEHAWEIIKKLDRNWNQDDNAAMMTGREVQAACDKVLMESFDISRATAEAIEAAIDYKPNDWEANDKENADRAIEDLPDIIKNAITGLQEAMHTYNRITGESELFGKLPGNILPYSTFPDYVGCGDLKVKTYKCAPNTKSGFRRPSLPKSLGGMFEKNNASQIAGFWALNGQKPPFLLYASKDDYSLLTPENCDELKPEFLRMLVEDSAIKNKAIEYKLQKAETMKDLLADEFVNFHEWRKPPPFIEEAKKLWSTFYE